MSQKCEFQYNLLPFETIKEATKGDVDAVENLCDKKYHIQRGHMEKATLL